MNKTQAAIAVVVLALCGTVQADTGTAAVKAKPVGAVYGGMGGLLVGGFLAGGPLGALVGGAVGMYAGDSVQELAANDDSAGAEQRATAGLSSAADRQPPVAD